MEFGKQFDKLPQLSKVDAEAEFNRPFISVGKRIVKSHVFCHHLDYLKITWPDVPIVLVYRPNDACLGWWVRCGQFDITYPNYQYYSNLATMAMHIDRQNADMLAFAAKHNAEFNIKDNLELANKLGIALPPAEYKQDYRNSDIKVAVV